MAAKRRVKKKQPLTFLLPKVRKQSIEMWEDRVCGGAIWVTVGFFLTSSILLVWLYKRLPPQVPLFYSRPWGEAQLAKTGMLVTLPLTILGVLMVNGLLGGWVFRKYKLLARIVLLVAALVGFLITFSVVKIMLLVL